MIGKEELSELVSEEMVGRYDRFSMIKEVMKDSSIIFCPVPDCLGRAHINGRFANCEKCGSRVCVAC